MALSWTWDDNKAVANCLQYRVAFEAAVFALDDPSARYELDEHPDGDRWQTLGQVGPNVLLVIHTWPDQGVGRIISARLATPLERRLYDGR
jgi:uncharacterized DUF497 family protein